MYIFQNYYFLLWLMPTCINVVWGGWLGNNFITSTLVHEIKKPTQK